MAWYPDAIGILFAVVMILILAAILLFLRGAAMLNEKQEKYYQNHCIGDVPKVGGDE